MTYPVKLLLVGFVIVIAIGAAQRFIPGGPSSGPRIASDIPAPSDAPFSKELRYERAKELVSPGEFVNAEPFTISSLIGKRVILIDFWTYSCINCKRTQPYLNDWYAKYRDAGLEIVGVHTPEFEFEKVPENVRAAVRNAGIEYPVVQDNEYGTWRAYRNQYWPRKYLIDADGYIIYDHIGEGDYRETERHIRGALAELANRAGISTTSLPDMASADSVTAEVGITKTPEIYFGALRNERYLGNITTGVEGVQSATLPPDENLRVNLTYLSGTWDISGEYAECVRDCGIRLSYEARQVNLVAESSVAATIRLRRDGEESGTVRVTAAELYRLLDDMTSGRHTIELSVPTGVRLYTFTFG